MAYETLPFFGDVYLSYLIFMVSPLILLVSATIVVFSCARISSHLFLGNLHVFKNSPQKSVEKLENYNLTIVKA